MADADEAAELYQRAMALRRQDHWGEGPLAAMREAAVAGHPVAMYQYAVDSARQSRYDEVEAWLTRAAEAGHPLAAQELERLRPKIESFRTEQQPRLDRDRAAAEQGDPAAMLRYALDLRGLNRSEATAWFERSAVAGHPEALTWWVNELYRMGRNREAFDWLETGAKRGDVEARRRLVDVFVRAKDSRGAAFWLQRGAEAGDVPSFRRLGQLLLEDGHRPEGLSWLQEASRRGDAEASSDLAEQALIEGDEDGAQEWLDRCAGTGWGEVYQARLWERRGRIEEAQALYVDLAEGADNALAMLFLGLLLERQGAWGQAQTWLEEASPDEDFGAYADCCALRVQARRAGDPAALQEAIARADDPALARPRI